MKYFEMNGKTASMIGLGTTGFWSGRNKGLENCILEAVNTYGINVIDTAEMYGKSEEALGRVLRKLDRSSLFIVDKILPENVTEQSFLPSLHNSLKKLGTDFIDLYLLHWRENADLAFLSSAMDEAVQRGLIRNWGVSNFDTQDLKDLFACGGKNCACNQVFYSIYERGAETELLPYMKEHNILPMSYSSLGSRYHPHPDIRQNKRIMNACSQAGISPEAVMLRMNQETGFISLFSTSSLIHLHSNLKEIPDDVFIELKTVFDREFPAPSFTYPLVKI